MKSKIIALVSLILLVIILILGENRVMALNRASRELQIGNTTISVELAVTQAEQERGLSFRNSLPSDHGMLFVSRVPVYQKMWMKDMNFPLDMIWLDSNLRVVGIQEQISPLSYPGIFSAGSPTSYVLEVNSGFVRTHHVAVGMLIDVL